MCEVIVNKLKQRIIGHMVWRTYTERDVELGHQGPRTATLIDFRYYGSGSWYASVREISLHHSFDSVADAVSKYY